VLPSHKMAGALKQPFCILQNAGLRIHMRYSSIGEFRVANCQTSTSSSPFHRH